METKNVYLHGKNTFRVSDLREIIEGAGDTDEVVIGFTDEANNVALMGRPTSVNFGVGVQQSGDSRCVVAIICEKAPQVVTIADSSKVVSTNVHVN